MAARTTLTALKKAQIGRASCRE
ncbi:MAG: hypothetical protein RI987_585, partial [Actinomycetota bacterium]